MNKVFIIGNLTRDPEIRYSAGSQTAVAKFSVALNRGKDQNGNDLGADFPNVTAFGRTAELVEKYLGKGRKIAIEGRITTGSYEKDGKKIYTTEITAERIEFLDKAPEQQKADAQEQMDIPTGFAKLTDDDIPF